MFFCCNISIVRLQNIFDYTAPSHYNCDVPYGAHIKYAICVRGLVLCSSCVLTRTDLSALCRLKRMDRQRRRMSEKDETPRREPKRITNIHITATSLPMSKMPCFDQSTYYRMDSLEPTEDTATDTSSSIVSVASYHVCVCV